MHGGRRCCRSRFGYFVQGVSARCIPAKSWITLVLEMLDQFYGYGFGNGSQWENFSYMIHGDHLKIVQMRAIWKISGKTWNRRNICTSKNILILFESPLNQKLQIWNRFQEWKQSINSLELFYEVWYDNPIFIMVFVAVCNQKVIKSKLQICATFSQN